MLQKLMHAFKLDKVDQLTSAQQKVHDLKLGGEKMTVFDVMSLGLTMHHAFHYTYIHVYILFQALYPEYTGLEALKVSFHVNLTSI